MLDVYEQPTWRKNQLFALFPLGDIHAVMHKLLIVAARLIQTQQSYDSGKVGSSAL